MTVGDQFNSHFFAQQMGRSHAPSPCGPRHSHPPQNQRIPLLCVKGHAEEWESLTPTRGATSKRGKTLPGALPYSLYAHRRQTARPGAIHTPAARPAVEPESRAVGPSRRTITAESCARDQGNAAKRHAGGRKPPPLVCAGGGGQPNTHPIRVRRSIVCPQLLVDPLPPLTPASNHKGSYPRMPSAQPTPVLLLPWFVGTREARVTQAHPGTRRATSVCRLRHDPMGQGPTEPHAGRSTFLLSCGGAGGGYY